MNKPTVHTLAAVLDPVCHRFFSAQESAGEVWHDMHVYHFCSETCRRRFVATPRRFVMPMQESGADLLRSNV